MKFIHLADLHFGKSIYGTSLIENGDQSFWVDSFLKVVDEEKPDAIVIAGDVFDRSAPSEDAVRLFSRMVTALHDRKIPVLTVAGNHDSVYRLAYFGDMLSELGVHFSFGLSGTNYSGAEQDEDDKSTGCILNHVTLQDEFGPVTFWLMPYVYPALIQHALSQDSQDEVLRETLRDYDKAVRALLEAQPINTDERNVIIAHQNVTANGVQGERGGSESMVGGVGQIDYTAFDAFEYAALGHIHAAYPVGREEVRYAGSPLCYHFDELRQAKKGPVVVNLKEKGAVPEIRTIEIAPLHPMRAISGAYEDIRSEESESRRTGEYIHVTITDQRITPAISQYLRELYAGRDSILMELKSDFNDFTGEAAKVTTEKINSQSVEELFADFYRERRGDEDPSEEDLDIINFAGEIMRNADVSQGPDAKAVDKLLKHLIKEA